jgi:NhaP-type Na+/H+ or K+/H+ antiporter
MSHDVLNGIVVLLALGAVAQWLAWRLKVPSISILLAVGFVTGPITGVFRPEEVLGDLTFPFVSLAAAVVLFEGGLTASLDEFRSVAAPVRLPYSSGFRSPGSYGPRRPTWPSV